MISVVMATLNSERNLVAALSPLIPASVDGIVRELVVADGGSSDATLEILEEAGAQLVQGGLDAACAAAKGPWLLIMTPTGRLPYEWVGPVRRVLESGAQRPVKLVRGIFGRSEALLIPKTAWAAGKRGGVRLRV